LKVLGIHWSHHDNAAALVDDGAVLAAVEEERLTRVKHGPWVYPRRAIAACLRQAGVDPTDLDAIAIDFAPTAGVALAVRELAGHRSVRVAASEIVRRSWTLVAPWVARRQLRSPLPATYVEHHLAHAAMAYYPSGADDAAILVVDGLGDFACTSMFHARHGRLRRVARYPFPESLGLFYASMTQFLGFEAFGDEYKVMGLAGHGRDRYRHQMAQLLRPRPGNGFAIDHDYFTFRDDYTRMPYFGPCLEALLGPPRRPHDPLDERHADLAASTQARLEETLLSLGRELRTRTGSRVACLAGGVALNCAANGRLRASGLFEHIFASSAPGDAGCAVGSALQVARESAASGASARFNARPYSPFVGPEFSDLEIARVVKLCAAPQTVLVDPPAAAAALLSAGHALGWFQGRLELGPRALGNRSILADPRDPAVPRLLNRLVKEREDFRPFAPAVLEELALEWFELAGTSPFMQFTVRVRPDKRSRIPAVVHVDGTARVQTVGPQDNPPFRRLIEQFAQRTGIPCVLNTSLNSRGQPIACSPEDALECLGRTGLRYLIIGQHLVAKAESDLQQALRVLNDLNEPAQGRRGFE
jgi:carbamoyltransferase